MIPHITESLLFFLAFGFLAFYPPGDICLPPAGNPKGAVRDVLGDRGTGADVGLFPDAPRDNQLRVAADEGAVLDDGGILLPPVVVAGDRARPDVHLGPDRRVAEVGEVIGFRPGPHRRLLQLHEIADLCPFAHHAFGAQMRERTDRCALCNTRTDDEAEIQNYGFVGDFRVNNADVSLDLAGGADPGVSLERDTRMDDCVGADFDVRFDVGRGRVDDGDAGCHEFFVLCLSHDSTHFRELGAAVDAPNLLWVVDGQRFHRQLAPAVDANQVSQVVLALGVLRGDAAQRVEER